MGISLKKSIPVIALMLVMVSIPNVYAESNIFQDAIRNPTADNAHVIFSISIPEDMERIGPIAEMGMNDTDSEILATNAMDLVFDIAENDILGQDNLDRATENFGERIFGMVTRITANAIESSFSLWN